MALRHDYTLGHSSLNNFLFEIVGEEENGQQLTVLSAMARLELNPWGEASRLSELSKEAATQALAAIFGRLPDDDWKKAGLLSIAGRLVAFLPDGGPESNVSARDNSGVGSEKPATDFRKILFWAALAAAGVVLILTQLGN